MVAKKKKVFHHFLCTICGKEVTTRRIMTKCDECNEWVIKHQRRKIKVANSGHRRKAGDRLLHSRRKN
jgi:predicted ATP-dependent serine protease